MTETDTDAFDRLAQIMLENNPTFRAWVETMPDKHWAKYDLMACRLGWEAKGAEPPQCCMCGKKGLSKVEGDGGTECELADGRWVCSQDCWVRAVDPSPVISDEAVATAKREIGHFLSDRASGYVNGISKQHLRNWLAALEAGKV
jgi:hypothetical protein